jgi:hypothetical protein
MAMAEMLVAEFDREMKPTRRLLEREPAAETGGPFVHLVAS